MLVFVAVYIIKAKNLLKSKERFSVQCWTVGGRQREKLFWAVTIQWAVAVEMTPGSHYNYNYKGLLFRNEELTQIAAQLIS